MNWKTTGRSYLAAGVFLLAACGQTYASTIVAWDFAPLPGGANNFGASPLAPTTSDSNVAVGGLTRGSGVSTAGTGAAHAWGGSGWDGTASAADAISASKYATFTLKPNTGFTLSLSSIDAYNIRHSGTGPATGQWQYSLDGSSFTNLGGPITWGSNTTAAGNVQPAISLASIPGGSNRCRRRPP